MCVWGSTREVRVWIDPRHSHTDKGRWKAVQIDECIAPIVQALQHEGINMLGSCCGHGKASGKIELADGRILEIHASEQSILERDKRLARAVLKEKR